MKNLKQEINKTKRHFIFNGFQFIKKISRSKYAFGTEKSLNIGTYRKANTFYKLNFMTND